MRPHTFTLSMFKTQNLSRETEHKEIAKRQSVPYNNSCVYRRLILYCVVARIPALPQGAATPCGDTPFALEFSVLYYHNHV